VAKESKELSSISEQQLAEYATEASAKERPSVSSISLRGGIMTYEGDAYPDNELTCIVVNHCFENRWYKGTFDPDNIDSPQCFAISMNKEDLVPHPNADAQAEVCNKCSKNEWGSDPRPNSRGKACKEIRRLALIPYVPELSPENVGDTEVAILKLPVTSVKNWSNYVNKVGASMKRPPWSVITKIKVVPDQKTQFKVTFDCPGAVDTALLTGLNNKREAVLPLLTAPYDPPTEGSAEEAAESDKY
jgi:hypothetical protein